jgi:hypothetical protein
MQIRRITGIYHHCGRDDHAGDGRSWTQDRLFRTLDVVIDAKLSFAVLCLASSSACAGQAHAESSHGQVGAPTSVEPDDLELAAQAEPTEPSSPETEGPPLTREEIRLVVRAKLPQVRACFDAGLERAPEIGGRVLLRFTIGPDGRAASVSVDEDELGDVVVTDCLRAELSSWQFPRPRAGVPITITYPFVFSSADSLRAAGLPRVEGTIKPAAVGAVFDARRSELDDCIPEAGTGTIGLALSIDDAGAVTRISSYESTLDERARSCVLRMVSTWNFPPAASGDEARVNHDLRW